MLPSGCAGYPLGYPSRRDIDINTKYTYLVQDRRPDAPVCQPGRQDIPGNNPFPPASVTPGQTLHLTWQPDGHLDDARPSVVEVHWTGVPDRRLHIRSELSPTTVLGVMTFATSANCDQAWEPNTWCHGYLTIPWGTQPGTYQLVWWWKYDRNPSGEEYSTCFEIVVSTGGAMQLRDLPVQALSHVEEALPSTPSSASSLSLPEERNDRGESPPRFEMASMTSDRMETTDDAFTEVAKGEEMLQSTDTLIEPTIQPDDTLSGTPDEAVGLNGKKNRGPNNNIYADDETGALAGDAINNKEGEDTSPLTIEKPSQLINSTLSEQLRKPNHNNNASVPQNFSGASASNSTASDATGIPSSQAGSSSTEPERESPLNQTSVGQIPTLDSGASDIASHPLVSGHCVALFTCALATLTWMLV